MWQNPFSLPCFIIWDTKGKITLSRCWSSCHESLLLLLRDIKCNLQTLIRHSFCYMLTTRAQPVRLTNKVVRGLRIGLYFGWSSQARKRNIWSTETLWKKLCFVWLVMQVWNKLKMDTDLTDYIITETPFG